MYIVVLLFCSFLCMRCVFSSFGDKILSKSLAFFFLLFFILSLSVRLLDEIRSKKKWIEEKEKTWWLKSDDRHCCIYVWVCVLWPSHQGEVGYVQLVSIDIEGEKERERERETKEGAEALFIYIYILFCSTRTYACTLARTSKKRERKRCRYDCCCLLMAVLFFLFVLFLYPNDYASFYNSSRTLSIVDYIAYTYWDIR